MQAQRFTSFHSVIAVRRVQTDVYLPGDQIFLVEVRVDARKEVYLIEAPDRESAKKRNKRVCNSIYSRRNLLTTELLRSSLISAVAAGQSQKRSRQALTTTC